MTMKIYLIAVILALASVTAIVNACMLHASSTRAVPVSISLFN
jgi:hypothetical protein